MKLRLSEASETFIRQYAESLPHAVLLSGPNGSGLSTLAHHMVSSSGTLLTVVRPESKTATSLPAISVAAIRQLYADTRAFMNGMHLVIIDDADTMNQSAQNALLKLLEEPNESIRFILTSHSVDKLLPTIRSRVQMFAVPPISDIESRRMIKSLGVTDSLDEQRLLFVANGRPAELARLAADPSMFRAVADRTQKARQFVEGTPYQRLALVQSMKEDRKNTLSLLETIIMLLRKSVKTNPDQSTLQLIDRLIAASQAIHANGSIKLHLSAAVI